MRPAGPLLPILHASAGELRLRAAGRVPLVAEA
jgi:hypothetical protein